MKKKKKNVSNSLLISETLNNFFKKTYEKTYHFYDIFSKFLKSCTCSQSFTISKFLEQKWRLLENVNKFLLIWANLNNFCEKTYENYYFYDIFSIFL